MRRLLALVVLAVGCADPATSVELAIDLRADLEPGVAFTTIETRLVDAAPEPARWDPPDVEALLEGARVAEYAGLAPGMDTLELRLLDRRDREVARAEIEVPLDVDRGVRLEIRAPRVIAGSRATCVIADGRRQCWGSSAYFEVGRRVDQVVRPVQVDGRVRDVCLASFHEGCAVLADGRLECLSAPGEPSASSATVHDGEDLARVVCGGVFGVLHRCHLATDGAVGCSGVDTVGQLGNGEGASDRPIGDPSAVEGVARAEDIAAGAVHGCALVAGDVWCWGQNADGRVGDRAMEDRAVPAVVEGLGRARGIAAGARHTCAVGEDGSVTCWGWNGRHGVSPSDDEAVLEPFVREDVTDAVEVSGGGSHTCARTASGDVRCWGGNDRGQLGDGTTTDRPEAIDVPLDGPALAIAAGFGHTCAVIDGEPPRVFCWGIDEAGQTTGGASTTDRTTPVEVELAAPLYSSQ